MSIPTRSLRAFSKRSTYYPNITYYLPTKATHIAVIDDHGPFAVWWFRSGLVLISVTCAIVLALNINVDEHWKRQ